jgi:pimeloyl-ACP methyl ester carboxylesterase
VPSVKRVIVGLIGLVVLLFAALLAWGYAPDTDPAEMQAKYANSASRFITVEPGLRVHVRDEGARGAPPLLLIHGSNSSLHTWEPWVARLGGRYRIISLDLAGHGLTGPHPRHDYAVETSVRLVDAVMSRLGIDRFAIAGNSMGGWVTWNYVLAHPERVTAMILVDASGAPDARATALPIGFRLAQSAAVRPLLKIVTPRSLVEKSLRQSVAVQSVVTPASVDRYWELLRYPGNREATGERQQAYPRRKPATEAEMKRITAPTLILWGARDTLTPVAGAKWFGSAITGAKTIIYPEIGHLPMEEDPDRSAADADAFLKAALSTP